MMTMLRLSLGLLSLCLALNVAAAQSSSFHPLLRDENLLRLNEIVYQPIELRCNLFIQALREILGVSHHKASGEQLLGHALQVLARKEHTHQPLFKELERCDLLRGKNVMGASLHSPDLVSELAHKAMDKLGLDGAKHHYGGEHGHIGEEPFGIGEHHLYDNHHHRYHGGNHLGAHGDYQSMAASLERLHHEKRHLERVLDSKMIDLHAMAREIKTLRNELEDLRLVANGKHYDVSSRIVDHAAYEALKVGHERSLQHQHHLKQVIRELEEELLLARGSRVGHHNGLHLSADEHDSYLYGEAVKIHDPTEQAVILAHQLARHHGLENVPSKCYRYYLLFSYPAAINRRTIKTIAMLRIKVRSMESFFRLVNPHYLRKLLHTSNRLAESLDESARRVGHEMRNCMVEAEEYVRLNRVHFDDFNLVESVQHLPNSVFTTKIEKHLLDGHHATGPVVYESHSAPTASTSTSTSTSGSGSAAAASAGAGASASAAASSSAATATKLSPISSIESLERHGII